MIRRPVVSGQFYESDAEALRVQVKNCFLSNLGPQKTPNVNPHFEPRKILGLVSPHAGYVYSGPVAAHGFYELANDGTPDMVVVMGPNHTGQGSALSLMREGSWRTPLGDVEINTEMADALLHESNIIDVDEVAHRFEHSIEVQLPFLQYLYGSNFKLVPICFLMQDIDSAMEVGRALTEVLDATNTVVIASSDMTHYESQQKVSEKDHQAIKNIISMDVKAFYQTLEARNVTACGFAPIAALMTYAKDALAKSSQLLAYHTSGDVTGDFSHVVGYASIRFSK